MSKGEVLPNQMKKPFALIMMIGEEWVTWECESTAEARRMRDRLMKVPEIQNTEGIRFRLFGLTFYELTGVLDETD